MDIQNQIIRYLERFCCFIKLVLPHGGQLLDFTVHFPDMADCLDDIAGSGFALGTDHGSPLVDPAQCLAQIFGTADKGYAEIPLIDMVDIIGRGKNFALINVVDLDGFQNLCIHKLPDPAFCHYGNGNGLLDSTDHLRIAYTGNAAGCTDVCGDPLQCHNGACACFLSVMAVRQLFLFLLLKQPRFSRDQIVLYI